MLTFFEKFLENEEKESVGWVKIWGMTSTKYQANHRYNTKQLQK